MKIKKVIAFREGYLPTPRHRKLRYRDVQEEVEIDVKEITEKNAPVALRVYSWDGTTKDYKYYNGKLWTKVLWQDKHTGKEGLLPKKKLQWYIRGVYDYWNYSKEDVINSYIEDAKRYLIIDGVVYEITGEPRYICMTFGLGHNHGGTSLMVSNWYNPNISKDRYFNALEREKAIEYTKNIALRRGDTKDIDRIGESYNIEVLIPEVIKCNPQKEHGEGDSFLNELNAITESTSSATEAGLLVMCATANEINRIK